MFIARLKVLINRRSATLPPQSLMMNTSDVRPVFTTTLLPPFHTPPFAGHSPYPPQMITMPYALPERRHRHHTDKFEQYTLTYSVPTFVYNSIMLFLPYFYRSRLHQVLRGVRLTKNELTSLVTGAPPGEYIEPKCWEEVKRCWGEFIDSVLQEWKTLNIVSALLLTAIYNILQLGGYGNRFIRCTALMSLVSALMSLIFGCLYVIRFETMRRPYKAMQWASDVLSSSRSIVWNVYILLALPSIWLAWSLILFLLCLMAIVWQPEDYATHTNVLGPISLNVKIAVSTLLAVGFVQLLLVLGTFFRYGGIYDKRWAEHLNSILYANASHPTADNHPTTYTEIFHEGSVSTADYYYTPYVYPIPGPYGAFHPGFANSSTGSYYSARDTISPPTMFTPHYHQSPYYTARHTPMSASSPHARTNARNDANNHVTAYEEAPLTPGFQYPAPLGRRQVQDPSTTAGNQQSLRDQPRERLNQMTSTSRIPTIKEEKSGEMSIPGSPNATFVVDEVGNSSTRPQDEQGQSGADKIQSDS